MTASGQLIGPVLGPSCKNGKGVITSDKDGITWSMRHGLGKNKMLDGVIPWSAVTRFALGRTAPAVAMLTLSYQNGPANDPAGSLTLITRKWSPPRYKDGWRISKPSLCDIAYHAELYLDPEDRDIEDSGHFGPVTGIKYEQARFERALAADRREHLELHSRWGAWGYKRYPGGNADSDDSFYDWIGAGCPDEWSSGQHRDYLVRYIQDVAGWTWPPEGFPELAGASADEIYRWIDARGAAVRSRWHHEP